MLFSLRTFVSSWRRCHGIHDCVLYGAGATGTGGIGVSDLWGGRPMAMNAHQFYSCSELNDISISFEKAPRCQELEIESDQRVCNTHCSLSPRSSIITNPSGHVARICSMKMAEMIAGVSFGIVFGLFSTMTMSEPKIISWAMRENLADVKRKLAPREAYLSAKAEMRQNDRQRLLAETMRLLRELGMTGLGAIAALPTMVERIEHYCNKDKESDE